MPPVVLLNTPTLTRNSSPGATIAGTFGVRMKSPLTSVAPSATPTRRALARDRDDAQPAVEVVGHGVAQVAPAGTDVDDARPVRHRRLALAVERVQVPREAAVGVAARRRQRQEALEVRQDQVEDLPRVDFEHPLLEEVAERVGVLVARHLQDALVDGQHRDPRRLARRHVASSASCRA